MPALRGKETGMARLVYAMNVSLDGYVDHDRFNPDPALFAHWTDVVRGLTGSICGRRIYDLMRYWDEDRPEWSPAEHAFAAAWRAHPKWVASRTLSAVGPDATLLRDDVGARVRALKAELSGEVAVSGTRLAAGLVDLIDEYRLYVHPEVLGQGTPFFAEARAPLRLVAADRIGDKALRLTCIPA
jgi:dihydrofolate reductase